MTANQPEASAPWAWSDGTGTYVGRDGSAWLYRVAPPAPHPAWVDAPALLGDVAAELTDPREIEGWVHPGDRAIHLLRLHWDQPVDFAVPDGLDPAVAEALTDALPHTVTLVGVRLIPLPSVARPGLRGLFTATTDTPSPVLSLCRPDAEAVSAVLQAAGFTAPDEELLNRVETWFHDDDDYATTLRFLRPADIAATSWAADVLANADGPSVVSLRSDITATRTTSTAIVGLHQAAAAPVPAGMARIDGHLLDAVAETLPASDRRAPDAEEFTDVDLDMTGIAARNPAPAAGLVAGLGVIDLHPHVVAVPDVGTHTVVIAGSGGVGRTTLARTFVDQAAAAGMTMRIDGDHADYPSATTSDTHVVDLHVIDGTVPDVDVSCKLRVVVASYPVATDLIEAADDLFLLAATDENDAAAALEALGISATTERVAFLLSAATGGPPRGLHSPAVGWPSLVAVALAVPDDDTTVDDETVAPDEVFEYLIERARAEGRTEIADWLTQSAH